MIKDIQTTSPRLSRLGIIRLGIKKVSPKGKEYPSEADHFVLTDAPDVLKVYGEAPKELLVYLPFAETDSNLIAYHELWSGAACLCRGDGERVIDMIKPGGVDRAVRDGMALMEFSADGLDFQAGEMVPCPGLEHSFARCKTCRPSGLLMVMVRNPEDPMQLVGDRLGYYQVRTNSYHNIQSMTGQLRYAEQIARSMGRTLQGIPLVLRRVSREITFIGKNRDTGAPELQKTTKWFLDLEFDMAWVRQAQQAMYSLAIGGALPALPAVIAEGVDLETGEIIEPEQEVMDEQQEQQPVTTTVPTAGHGPSVKGNGKALARPYDAETLKKQIAIKVSKSGLKGEATDAQKQKAAIAIGEVFEGTDNPDAYRHTLVGYIFAKAGLSELDKAEISVLIDWLESEHAFNEAWAVMDADARAKGQMDLFAQAQEQAEADAA